MNRRSFMRTLAGAVAGFTVLPPATTYERVWRATRMPSMGVRYWVPEEYAGRWRWVNVTENDHALAILEQRFVEHIESERVPSYLLPVARAPFPHGAGEPQFAELRTINFTGAPRRVVRQVAVSVPTSGVPVPLDKP